MTIVTTPPAPLLQPMVAMMLLTALVWLIMYIRRVGYLKARRVDLQTVNTPQKMSATLPEAVEAPSNNLKNLFELPVLFYAVCGLLLQQGWATPVDVMAAWVFVGARAVHSLVHCTVNIVMWRFSAYAVAAMALWFMLARLAVQVWA